MKSLRLLLIASLLTLVLLSSAEAFDLVSMQPNYARFEVYTTEPLVLVFSESLDPATVGDGAIAIENLRDGESVSGAITLSTTSVTDDTLTFTPAGGAFPFGRRLEVTLDEDLRDLDGDGFTGELPDYGIFVANISNDFERPDYSGGFTTDVFVNSNVLLGFNPLDPENENSNDPHYVPGMYATEAWKITTGRPEVLIAVLDDGANSLSDLEFADHLWLNKGELPQPRDGATLCDDWDCNGDGRFNAWDYENDSRMSDANANGRLDPDDLFLIFSDEEDNDDNGFVDDISGWDFFRNTNQALGVNEFPEGTHGGGRARDAVAIADNSNGNKPGFCPDCSIVLIRVGEAIMTELNLVTAGLNYARSLGADIGIAAIGMADFNVEAEQAVTEAYEDGMLLIAASGDELGFHHIWPAAGEDAYSIKAIMPLPPVELFGPINLSILAFVESYCTNYGAHIDATAVTGACSSEGTSNAAGIAGLIKSRSLELGIDLTAGEIKQIMNMSTQDIKDACFAFNMRGCKKGWEENFGYGRINAAEALKLLGDPVFGIPERIPPDVRIVSPRWWTTFDPTKTPSFDIEGQIYARGRPFHYSVQIGFGVEPDDNDFIELVSGDSTEKIDGKLATVNMLDHVTEDWLRRIPEGSNDFTVTLRVQATWESDDGPVLGEARKAIAWHTDDDDRTGLMPGFPKFIGASGESSPVLYDLDGDVDGALEIVFGTSASTVEAYKYNKETGEYELAPGFPVELPQVSAYQDAVEASVAVGPLFGDGIPYIVAATWNGIVYAVYPDGNEHSGGPFVPGFPVEADEPDNTTPLSWGHGRGFFASPILSDLDQDGMLEIVAASFNQHAYAWRPVDENEDGLADLLPGWPVPLFSDAEHGLVSWDKICEEAGPAQELGTPVAGILDPFHADTDISEHPAVIIATTEVCNNDMLPTSRVYAIYWNGLDNEDGPFLPGWPAKVMAPFGDALPIPPLTVGSTASPAAAIVDGELLVGVSTFFWFPQMIHWSGNELEVKHLNSHVNLGVSGNGTFGKFDETDNLWYFLPTAGFLQSSEGNFYLESFNVCGWRMDDPNNNYWRKRFEDINFIVNPLVADLDSDGLGELIAGSGGYLIHAANVDLQEPEGWPKFTQNWMLGSLAVDDLNGDGLVEAVAYSHEGNLFAWYTRGKACRRGESTREWGRFHHDNYNSGFYGADTLPPRMVRDLVAYKTDDPDVFELHFTAPGDDHDCGTALSYDLRYTTDSGVDLRSASGWSGATSLESVTPIEGGLEVVVKVTAPGAASFALRSFDDVGLMSYISNAAKPEDAPPADDDAADDDTAADDDADDDQGTGDDDDDTGGCGC